MTSGSGHVVLDLELSPAVGPGPRPQLRGSPELAGIVLEPVDVRRYLPGGGPSTSLASQPIGFVNSAGAGQYGVEQHYQSVLAGSPRVVTADRDAAGNPIPDTTTVIDAGTPGTDLRLTIDASLQLAVEQELLTAWIADRAGSVSAVVIDPYSGEILAEASYPSYDANDYRQIATDDPSRFLDPIVSEVYEPGSVFKMLTAIAGFESGTVGTATQIKDVNTLWLDQHRAKVTDADRRGMGWMSFQDAIAYSRNIVASKVALGLAKTTAGAAAKLHEVWQRFGFGAPTGIDVAGEVGGIVNNPAIRPWRQIDLANGSFGQGVAVTPIQLATAFSAMVNGGRLVQPHVVQAVGARDVQATDGKQVLAAGMSATLIKLMNHVVTEVPFYRDRTLIPGYYVGGKTGTAQIWDAKAGDWKVNLFNYSFVGYIGRQTGRPDVVVAVQIHEGTPSIARIGHLEMPVMSFELFRRIAQDAITTPGLVPERPIVPISATADR